MIKRLVICCIFLLISVPANAAPLVADLSNYRIDMDAGFSGTRLFLFGARNDNGDIIAVIRGPQKDFIVRKKEQVAGVWINRDRIKFFDVPSFYAIAASKPLTDIEQDALFRQIGIGQANLLTSPSSPKGRVSYSEFAEAFLNHQYAQRLYTREVGSIRFMGETLFKTLIEFPDNIPPGKYTAEIYLISDGEVVGMQSTPIEVVKTGLDAFLYRYAHDFPALYGLTAILLALGAGWFAGRIFERI